MEADERPYTTVSFYRYFSVEEPMAFRNELFVKMTQLEVVGRIYIAHEGINAQIAMPSMHFDAFKTMLYSYACFDGLRLNIAIEERQKSFIKLDFKVREKIVADGIEDPTFSMENRGKYLKAREWNTMMEKEGTVVIDMRNHYESEVGRFEGASCPDTDTFREELARINELYAEEKDKTILMYCTGGIRCEKASAWMKHLGFSEVYHLEGGIINYVNQVKSEGIDNKFKGVNFVFDQRLAERVSEDVIAVCHQCGEPADTHINCANTGCHLLFIQCAACAEQYQKCCSVSCKEVIQLPEEVQRTMRKGKPAGRIFSKGRFPKMG
jgi:UPF0176 protein